MVNLSAEAVHTDDLSHCESEVSLELKDIEKKFGGVEALKGASFSVLSGEVHALLGENGAGKSTLMGIAVGEIEPDTGSIVVDGRPVADLDPQSAQELGIAIVHQSPALVPALTVLENFRLSVPFASLGGEKPVAWVRRQLEAVECFVSPHTRATELSIAQRQQIELAKAFALNPKILILDEPTAALTADMVRVLFEKVRTVTQQGTAVIYISHRLEEIRQICDRVTVMRDGRIQAVAPLDELRDDEILKLIVGRETHTVYPPKSDVRFSGGLAVRKLSGHSFEEIDIDVGPGEIVGLAGITGNGQADLLRALAGLVPATGEIILNGSRLTLDGSTTAHRAGISFMSSDRPNEGLVLRMSVRENVAIGALPRFAKHHLLSRQLERNSVEQLRQRLSIKTPSIDTIASNLSGGNQQKVVLSRALLAEPELLLAEEPTAGVDIGARSEIYHILRDYAHSGKSVLVLSSDLAELEGLCDRVYVFSRGRIVAQLSGDEVSQEGIGREMLSAPTTFRDAGNTHGKRGMQFGVINRIRKFMAGDSSPALILLLIITIISYYIFLENPLFLSPFNTERILILAAALSLVAYGQLCVVLTGGLDLSVGPLVGLTVVLCSFFFGAAGDIHVVILGVLVALCVGAVTGLANGFLVEGLRFTPVAATLGTYIILQGVSVLLRPYPDGLIDPMLIEIVQASYLGIPVVFILSVLLVIGLEVVLRYSRWGISLRAIGSDKLSSSKIGVRTGLTVLSAYLLSSLLATVGGLLVAMQLGIGDPNQGVEYTLSSVAAVVLGGASLFGGRGSFVAVLLGALLLVVSNSAMSFVGLSGAWQYWFMGGLTLVSVALYSRARL